MAIDANKKIEHSSIFSVIIKVDEKAVTLDNTDIVELYFIEDIFSFCVTGKLIFEDLIGLFEFGPFTGNETVTVIYGDDEDIVREFDIYKVSNISQAMISQITSGNIIELILVDTTYINLTKKRYSRSWKDTKISTIVRDIGKNMLDIDEFNDIEDTNETLDYFYMPYWTPQEAILWLMRRGSSVNYNISGYLFYNNSKGNNFITLEKLLQQTKLVDAYDKDTGVYVFESKNLYYRNKILSWSISSIDTTSAGIIRGGHRFGYDFNTKTFIDNSYKYSTSISKYTMLGKKTLFIDVSDDTIRYDIEGESNSDIIDNMYYSKFIKKYCLQQCPIIVTRGSEGRYAGGMIEIKWPSIAAKEKFNSLLEGKFLIKSITHSFSNSTPSYRNKMVLIKNAYTDIEHHKNLVKSTKTNIYSFKGHG